MGQRFGCNKASHTGNANDSLNRKGLVVKLVAKWCHMFAAICLYFASNIVGWSAGMVVREWSSHSCHMSRSGSSHHGWHNPGALPWEPSGGWLPWKEEGMARAWTIFNQKVLIMERWRRDEECKAQVKRDCRSNCPGGSYPGRSWRVTSEGMECEESVGRRNRRVASINILTAVAESHIMQL